MDGDRGTVWRSKQSRASSRRPHSITIDMHRTTVVSGLTYQPPRHDANRRIATYSIHLSRDGKTWGQAVATGSLAGDAMTTTLSFAPKGTRFVRLTATAETDARSPRLSAREINLLGDPGTTPASVIDLPRDGWTASGEEAGAKGSDARLVLDGDRGTVWRSKQSRASSRRPHSITIDMHRTTVVSGLTYQPPRHGANGRIGHYSISTSSDGIAFAPPVATGTWRDDDSVKGATFTRPATARYVRLTATTEASGRETFSSAAELQLSGPAKPAVHGVWGPVKGFPLVPVATAVLPNNKLLAWSAYAHDRFGKAHGYTQTATMDLTTGKISRRRVANTRHDMFCPGTATLADGRVLVTGGSNAERASIYNPATDKWTSTSNMKTARGYQGMTLLSSGDAFVIGGSWSGNPAASKNGEVWSPATGTWRKLPGVPVKNTMTADPKGRRRADNHQWLHATSNGRVLHLGPSKQLNWISTKGDGTITPAGTRADSKDAMNGNAVAYDIGKLLTLGGATAYENAPATRRAYTVSLNHSAHPVSARTGDMAQARAFSNSVVMPDGKVAVFGGQSTPVPLSDARSVMNPEIWDPATGRFTSMASMAVPRNYHSVANLLPDGRIFTGGGGLCGNCATNHPNGAIFTPPYLLKPNGTKRPRPHITSATPAKVEHGTKLPVTTDSAISSFALVRAGVATHSTNNDQRRIPLNYRTKGANSYELSIPADSGIALPGTYMLFALNKRGVPSKAAILTVGSASSTPRHVRPPQQNAS
ncbi:discoidin domain-containing protein [Streptomyces sirii]|uniref:discoidin domain-containing protein n=1 Tax=Streptomyces sirii TaxID=3127701 RepID=UPI003D368295